jgi:hypothetical protein
MFSAGIREIVNFILNGNKFTEEVQIAFQDAKGGFPEKPNVSGRFTIRVDKAPIRGGFAYARYERGGTCDLGGDFNGDGLRDMAIADGPARVSIYLCEGATFAGEPFMTATIQEDSDFSVTDIDGDGHPDIMTVYSEKQEGKYVAKRRAYLSREAPPQ